MPHIGFTISLFSFCATPDTYTNDWWNNKEKWKDMENFITVLDLKTIWTWFEAGAKTDLCGCWTIMVTGNTSFSHYTVTKLSTTIFSSILIFIITLTVHHIFSFILLFIFVYSLSSIFLSTQSLISGSSTMNLHELRTFISAYNITVC